MAKLRLQHRLRGVPSNTGPAATTGPVPLTIPQCCMHRPGVKCVQANTCPCRSANFTCTSGRPSENCRNRGPTRAPTAPTLMIKVRKNTKGDQEATLTLCHAPPLTIFHQDAPAFSTIVLPRGDEGHDLLARADTTHAALALTETTAPDLSALAAVRSGKRSSNHT